jgi:hypothetical protein
VEERRGIGFQRVEEAGAESGGVTEWQSAAMVLETRPGS